MACYPQAAEERIYSLQQALLSENASEWVDYLLLHCSFSWQIWSIFLCIFGVHWVIPSNFRELLIFGKHRELTGARRSFGGQSP